MNDDLLILLIQKLDDESLIVARQVSHKWRQLCKKRLNRRSSPKWNHWRVRKECSKIDRKIHKLRSILRLSNFDEIHHVEKRGKQWISNFKAFRKSETVSRELHRSITHRINDNQLIYVTFVRLFPKFLHGYRRLVLNVNFNERFIVGDRLIIQNPNSDNQSPWFFDCRYLRKMIKSVANEPNFKYFSVDDSYVRYNCYIWYKCSTVAQMPSNGAKFSALVKDHEYKKYKVADDHLYQIDSFKNDSINQQKLYHRDQWRQNWKRSWPIIKMRQTWLDPEELKALMRP